MRKHTKSLLLALAFATGAAQASDDLYGYHCAYAGGTDCSEHVWTTPEWGGEHGINSLGICNSHSETLYDACEIEDADSREAAYDLYYYHAAGY